MFAIHAEIKSVITKAGIEKVIRECSATIIREQALRFMFTIYAAEP
jgi:hypothetical protein